MAAPHIAGAAALLLQRHPAWSPRQVKSALVSTAGPAWARHGPLGRGARAHGGLGPRGRRRRERPQALHRPGLALVLGSERDPRRRLEVAPARRHRRGRRRRDVDGGGAAAVRTRAASRSPSPSAITVAPGGDALVPVTARAAGDAGTGEAYGFLLLRRGDVVRKVPYAMLVTRPGLAVRAGRCRSGSSRPGRRCAASRAPPPTATPPPPSGRRRTTSARPSTRTAPRSSTGSGSTSLRSTSARRSSPRRTGSLDPPVAARLAGRERRPGVLRHARQREQPHDRLPDRRRRRRRRSSRARRRTTSRSTAAATSSPGAPSAASTSSAPGSTTCGRPSSG